MTSRRDRQGQGLVEFAIIVPIFLLMLLILVDFGRVIFAQNAITQDARSAARFASVSAAQLPADIRLAARVVSPGVAMPNTAITGDSGSNDFYPDGTEPGDRVVVKIQVTVPIIAPIVSTIVGGGFTINARAEEFVK